MEKKKLIIILLITVIIIVVVVAITKNNKKDKNNNGNTIISNNTQVTVMTREERVENAIDSVLTRLEKAGMTVTKLTEVTLDEASGYKVKLNNETVEIYYLEKQKLSKIVESVQNGETTITINGAAEKALVYESIFILNCTSSQNQELIEQALNQGNRNNVSINNQ